MTIHKILTLIKQFFLPDYLTNQFQMSILKIAECLTKKLLSSFNVKLMNKLDINQFKTLKKSENFLINLVNGKTFVDWI